MSEPAEGPGAPLPGHHRAAPYRRVIGAHRAPIQGHPRHGYLFTVALLAGTASMPILAAISTGSATVGNTALPDTSTPFIPTPSIGPVVIAAQSPAPSSRTPAAATSLPPTASVIADAPALPDDSDLRSHHRFRPAVTPTCPTVPPPATPPRPRPSPSPSPSASDPANPDPAIPDPASPDPAPSLTAEPTATVSEPAADPSGSLRAEPSGSPSPVESPAPSGSPSGAVPATLRPGRR